MNKFRTLLRMNGFTLAMLSVIAALVVALVAAMLFDPRIPKTFGAGPETENWRKAVNGLQAIACGQLPLLCQDYLTYPHCPGDVCWNSSSIIGSTDDLESALGITLDQAAAQNGGDIRYRCRYQKNQLYCFVYRCLWQEPAGCRPQQNWYMVYKFAYSEGPAEGELHPVWSGQAYCIGTNNAGCQSAIDADNTLPCISYSCPDAEG